MLKELHTKYLYLRMSALGIFEKRAYVNKTMLTDPWVCLISNP